MAGLDLMKMYGVDYKPGEFNAGGASPSGAGFYGAGAYDSLREAAGQFAASEKEREARIGQYNEVLQGMVSDYQDVSGKADTLWDDIMGDLTGGDYTQYLQTESSKAVIDPLKEAVGIADTQQQTAESWLTQIVSDYEGLLPEAKRQALAGVLSTQIDMGALGRAEGTVASEFASQRDAARRDAASMGLSAGQMAGMDRRASLTEAATRAAAREKARVAETERTEEAKKFNYEAVAKLAGMGEEMEKAGMTQVASAAEQAGESRKDLSAGTESLIESQQNLLGEQLDAAKYLTGLAGQSAEGIASYAQSATGTGTQKTGGTSVTASSPGITGSLKDIYGNTKYTSAGLT